MFVFCRMHYLSPALILGENFQLPFDARTLQRERKRWMAELELAGKDVAEVYGREMTKNELIEYFEELQRGEIAAWHFALGGDAVLLRFLQDGAIKPGARFKDSDLYNDPAFIAWLSPYFRNAFTRLVTQCFEEGDAPCMRTVLDNALLMTVNDQENAWLFINGILEKNIAWFDQYRQRPQLHISRISAFVGHGYLEVIRQLPDHRFGRTKDSFAFGMQHPAIALFNRDPKNRGIAIIWIEEALSLAVSPQVKAKLQAKLDEMHGFLKKRATKRKRRIISYAVLGVMFILSIISGDDSSVLFHAHTPAPSIFSSKSQLDSLRTDTIFVHPPPRDSAVVR